MPNDYVGQMGYHTNAYEYNPMGGDPIHALIKMIAGGVVFPYNKYETAPLGMSQRDFDLIKYNSEIAKNFRGTYQNFNPIAIGTATHAMKALGIQDAHKLFINNTGGITSLGNMISMTADKLLGADTNPWASLGNAKASFWAQMKGLNFDSGSLYRPGGGLSVNQVNTVVDQMMYGTYSDTAMTQTRGLWDQKDIMNIAAIGRDYNLYKGIQTKDIAKRTHEMGQVIQSSMNTFGVADKEEALRAIIEVTGGDIEISDTSKYQNILTRIKSIGESANLSAQVIKAVLDRGTEVGKMLGNTGVTSVNLNLAAIDTLRLSNSKLPFAVGAQEMQRLVSDQYQQIAASDASQRLGGIYAISNEAERVEIERGNISTGNKMTANELARRKTIIAQRRASERGISFNQAMQEVELDYDRNRKKGVEEISTKDPTFFARTGMRQDLISMLDATNIPEEAEALRRLIDPTIYEKETGTTSGDAIMKLRQKDMERIRASYLKIKKDLVMSSDRNLTEENAHNIAQHSYDEVFNQEEMAEKRRISKVASDSMYVETKAKEALRKKNSGFSDAINTFLSGEGLEAAFHAASPTPDLGSAQNTKSIREFLEYSLSTPQARERINWGVALLGGKLNDPSQLKELMGLSFGDLTGDKTYDKELKSLLESGAEITPNAINEELLKKNIKVSTRKLLDITKAYNPEHLKNILSKKPELFGDTSFGSWEEFAKSDYIKNIEKMYMGGTPFKNKQEYEEFTKETNQRELYLSTIGTEEERKAYLAEMEPGIAKGLEQMKAEESRKKVQQGYELRKNLLFNPDSITKIKMRSPVSKEELATARELLKSQGDALSVRSKAYGLPFAIREALADNSDLMKFTRDPIAFASMFEALEPDTSKIDSGKYEEVSLERPTDVKGYETLKKTLRGFNETTLLGILDVDKGKITEKDTADKLRLERMKSIPEFKDMTDEQRKQSLYYAQEYKNEKLFNMGVGTDKNDKLFSIDTTLKDIKNMLLSNAF